MIIRRVTTMLGLAALLAALSACGSPGDSTPLGGIAPASPDVEPGAIVKFVASVAGTADDTANWSVLEPDGGTIDATGSYTAPLNEGTYTVLASFTSLATTESTAVRVKRNVRVDVSPTSATLAPGDSLALAASVTGNVKTVTWSVAEAPDGGTVTAAGVYTAPQTAGTYDVVATSTADPSKTGVATIMVTATPLPAPPPPTVAIAVTPQAASIVAGNSLQFAAPVTGSTNVGVTWSVAESGGGTVSASGVYTAPATAGAYHVVAKSQADTSKTASAAVTVTALPPPPPPPSGVVTAFPGAQGGGALTKGGRGGKVIEVTNLADSGTGSLRACIQATGPRICVFRTGGTISLLSGLRITNPYITIAGQTAPGGGIQLRATSTNNHVLAVNTHDVIIRYLRVRHGSTGATTAAGAGITLQGSSSSNVENIIVDHCSIEWSQDDQGSVWAGAGNFPPRNITWSWNLAAEPLKAHATAMIMGCEDSSLCPLMTNVDLHHNFLGSFSHRAPLLRLDKFRFVNNIVYDWHTWATGIYGPIATDVIGNVYRRFHAPDSSWYHEIDMTAGASLYISGNIGPNNSSPTNDNWGMIAQVSGEGAYECSSGTCTSSNTTSPSRSYQRTTPLPALTAPIAVTPVGSGGATLQSLLLNTGNEGGPVGVSRRLQCDGTWVAAYDPVDSRIVNGYPTQGVYPVSEADVGGFPTLAAGTPCTDSDHDGMPDDWERAHGLDPSNASDGAAVGSDGYTNLDRYLNGQ